VGYCEKRDSKLLSKEEMALNVDLMKRFKRIILSKYYLSYQRKQFKFTLPIREIQKSDSNQTFTNELQPVNDIDLAYLIENNIGKRYVMAYDLDGKVNGFFDIY